MRAALDRAGGEQGRRARELARGKAPAAAAATSHSRSTASHRHAPGQPHCPALLCRDPPGGSLSLSPSSYSLLRSLTTFPRPFSSSFLCSPDASLSLPSPLPLSLSRPPLFRSATPLSRSASISLSLRFSRRRLPPARQPPSTASTTHKSTSRAWEHVSPDPPPPVLDRLLADALVEAALRRHSRPSLSCALPRPSADLNASRPPVCSLCLRLPATLIPCPPRTDLSTCSLAEPAKPRRPADAPALVRRLSITGRSSPVEWSAV
ncbi:hypothetical protein CDD83_7298 [Cordyceps sp. RAO-2017]|nr:hypothetical protein CDD83_7298 [Cordyceps sp. RAO-2017]